MERKNPASLWSWDSMEGPFLTCCPAGGGLGLMVADQGSVFLEGVVARKCGVLHKCILTSKHPTPPSSTYILWHPQGSGSSLERWGPQNRGAIVWGRVPAWQSNAAPPKKIMSHAEHKLTGANETPKHHLWNEGECVRERGMEREWRKEEGGC